MQKALALLTAGNTRARACSRSSSASSRGEPRLLRRLLGYSKRHRVAIQPVELTVECQ